MFFRSTVQVRNEASNSESSVASLVVVYSGQNALTGTTFFQLARLRSHTVVPCRSSLSLYAKV